MSIRVSRIYPIVVLLAVGLNSGFDANSQISFSYQSAYSYLKGIDASGLAVEWKNPGFDDSEWLKGSAPFWYGDGINGTRLSDMINSYSTIFLRSEFECSGSSSIKELGISVDFDDGFILYINGAEALRRNAPSDPAYNSFAPAYHESGVGEKFTVAAQPFDLKDGTNIIAVEVFNNSLASSDIYFDLSINGELSLPELPDSSKISFSGTSGFFYEPFILKITASDPAAQIAYTLDGSDPENPVRRFLAGSPASVRIDPSDSTGRPLTPLVIIRASVYKQGFRTTKPELRTFIFPQKIKTQTWPGGGWPSSDINGQKIDLDMDPYVVNSSEYSGLFENALKYIPTISVVTDIKNLFDPASGIYVNAFGHGNEWEKECSVELINPDGSPGFMINAGLRIRGGYSRDGAFPKHAFRLFFRQEYGSPKLKYPLFGKEGTDEFDKIDLRCEQNYSWSNCCRNNSFVREVFSRDTQRDMGRPYTRSRYCHLYLNGMYWGLYQTQERAEARYASSYFGGKSDDYDVVKVNVENWSYTIEATDGNLNSWQKLWNMCSSGFASDKNYFSLEGKDEKGRPVKGGQIMVDIDNLIDYMLVIFYTGNFDSPTSAFGKNKGANNFYAIDDRTDNSKGFVFFTHDAEHSMFNEAYPPGTGLNEDRVNIGTRGDDMRMTVNNFEDFHPQWLHFKLSVNSEYRTRFADRAYSCFQPGGVFTPDSSLTRLNKRVEEVDMAVIAESARWGDTQTSPGNAYTRNNDWVPEIEKIRKDYIPYRSELVIEQLKRAGLYPEIESPQIIGPEGRLNIGTCRFTAPVKVTVKNPNNAGTIYYTLDGNDPRVPGGGIFSGSLFSINNIDISLASSSLITARIYSGGKWSAPAIISFIAGRPDYDKLKVTELHYHPPDYISGSDTISGKDLEFIEFKNTGKNAVNLSGLELDSAVDYRFPENKLLPPGNFFVVASKPSEFYNYYGLVASGNYSGNFSNSGEEVLLKDVFGNRVIDFLYSDSDPWPSKADGEGYSLSSKEINPAGDPAVYDYWTLSVKKDGTPFADNVLSDSNNDNSLIPGTLTVYPNPTAGLITFRLETNGEAGLSEIRVFDQTGKLVIHTFAGNPDMIDLSSFRLPEGLYFIRVLNGKYSGDRPVILIGKH